MEVLPLEVLPHTLPHTQRHTPHTQPRRFFYSLLDAKMKNPTIKQFRNCQATEATFNATSGKFTIFYSYTCPELVIFPTGIAYRFTFENSRKAGAITRSRTTAKQCYKYRGGSEYRDLPTINLATFEADFFDTRLEKYY